jgi:hypothetical protein
MKRTKRMKRMRAVVALSIMLASIPLAMAVFGTEKHNTLGHPVIQATSVVSSVVVAP